MLAYKVAMLASDLSDSLAKERCETWGRAGEDDWMDPSDLAAEAWGGDGERGPL